MKYYSISCLAAMSLLAACTIVRIDSGGDVKVSTHAGVLRIIPDERSSDFVAYRVRGLGVVPTRNGLTLGWAAEDAALVNDLSRCRIVIFAPPKRADAPWRDLFVGREDICSTGGRQDESNDE